MSASRAAVLCLCLIGVWYAAAQPLLDREELRKIPLNDAVVIAPRGRWQLVSPYQSWPANTTVRRPGADRHTEVSGIEQSDGQARIVVGEPGRQAEWCRSLPFEFEADRYPFLILTYRATGILASGEPLMRLECTKGVQLVPLANGDLIPDGKVHEEVVDLRALGDGGRIRGISLLPHCRGPEPAVLEVLGICLESDRRLPPLDLPKDKELVVRVADMQGQAVPGATVTVDPELLNVSRSRETDAAGRAALRVHGGYGQCLRVEKAGMATAEYRVANGRGLPTAITLRRGEPYRGTVLDRKGRAIPFAAVQLRIRSDKSMPFGTSDQILTTLSDERGKWRTPALPIEGFATRSLPTARGIHHSGERMAPVAISLADVLAGRSMVLTLQRAVPLRGRVIAPQGQPVEGLSARLWPAQRSTEERVRQARTDGEGRFVFPRPGLGGHSLVIHGGALAPKAVPVFVKQGMAEVIVRMQPGQTIRGRVVDPDGNPLPGMQIEATEWRSFLSDYWQARTDGQGRFAWQEAPEGVTRFRVSGRERISIARYPLQPSNEEQTIALPSILRLHGTINDAVTEKPIPHCLILGGKAPRWDNPAEQTPPTWGRNGAWKAAQGTYELRINRISHGQILGLRFGEAHGYVPHTIFPMEIGAGGERRLDIRLQPEQHQGLAPVVRQPDGRPAAGAKIYFLKPRQQLTIGNNGGEDLVQVQIPRKLAAETDSEGRYRLSPQGGLGYLVVCHPTGFLEVDAQQAQTPLGLQLQAWATVKGMCRSEGKPAVGHELYLFPDRKSLPADSPRVDYWLNADTNVAGRYIFHRVPPGHGHIYDGFVGGERPRRGVPYQVAPGKTVRVDFGGEGRHVTGRLALPDGMPQAVGWNRGWGSLADGKRTYHFTVGKTGVFHIEDVPAGDWQLRINLWSPLPDPYKRDERELWGSVTRRLAVPKAAGEDSRGALDLGTLVLEVEE